jgi:hypothetical protein
MKTIVNKILATTKKLWLEDKTAAKVAPQRKQSVETGRGLTYQVKWISKPKPV